MLDLIAKGAASYLSTPRAEPGTGKKLDAQFPATTTQQSGKSCCDPSLDKDGDGRCDAGGQNWSDPTWRALHFAPRGPLYYRYTFESSGTLGDAMYTATAYGDLDCDGTFSTFQVVGRADKDNCTRAECSAVSAPVVFRDRELE